VDPNQIEQASKTKAEVDNAQLRERVQELEELAYRYQRPGYERETYRDMAHRLMDHNADLLDEVAALKSQLSR